MSARLRWSCALGLWATAAALGTGVDGVRAWAGQLLRPFALPFLWRSVESARVGGDAGEAFAKAQLLLAALPGWADGYTVFAYRFALDGDDTQLPAAARGPAARDRLLLALTLLETARRECPRAEIDLLLSMAFLVELVARREAGLAGLLDADPAILADRYLAAAERLGAGATVREQRLFHVAPLCAALLRAGDRDRALAVLDDTIARCGEIRDLELGGEWAATLALVRRRLAGDTAVDVRPLSDDQRLLPLLPFLD